MTCYVCKVDKEPEEFRPDRSKVSGRMSRCRPCDNAKSRAYYAANRERVIARTKPVALARYRSDPAAAREYQRQRYRERNPPPDPRSCSHCGEPFMPTRSDQGYCSKRCYDRSRVTDKGAARRGSPGKTDRRAIFERDGWTCRLCFDPIDPGLSWPDLMSASLDHIVPISRGGDHSPGNSQASHLLCNIVKGNRATFLSR